MRFNFVLVAVAALAAPFMGVAASPVPDPVPEPDMSANLFSRQTMELMGSQFTATCNSFSLNSRYPTLFYANCRAIDGSWKSSHVDLQLCLANSCGRLVIALRGRYGDSCDKFDCALSGSWFQCNCRDCGGNTQFSGLNLNDAIGNDNGELECFGLKQLG
ncbi:hypothetical protein CkaCkLH20_10578 [Colletotrichum karsti]|uniref:Cyanovirin-N domain-containing protein n=1 Tax=Colletotrichum karsti TaxID=1095194 RepID=A0A9P6HZC9_9PEZI|nr:uncharacterized protein CkaCkLH20_10578 [Colletotrichum karsti]KAF9871946.1 hypothetical protein CkaCkLH20_10578 [Colletotrichum karsti]